MFRWRNETKKAIDAFEADRATPMPNDDPVDLEPVASTYWKRINYEDGKHVQTWTYEHELPNGTLIRVLTIARGPSPSEAVVFVPRLAPSDGAFR